jgi:hypothetical protein
VQVTVGSFKEYLDSYHPDALIKFAVEGSYEEDGDVLDFSHIEGKDHCVIIHPYFPPFYGEDKHE